MHYRYLQGVPQASLPDNSSIPFNDPEPKGALPEIYEDPNAVRLHCSVKNHRVEE